MPSIYDVRPKQTLTFSVYPTAYIGSNFNNVQLEAIIGPEVAVQLGLDISAAHANVYPTLPDPKPSSAYDYDYILIKYISSGETAIIGVPWINESTIVVGTGGKVTMTFDSLTVDDKNAALLALSANGFVPDKVTVE